MNTNLEQKTRFEKQIAGFFENPDHLTISEMECLATLLTTRQFVRESDMNLFTENLFKLHKISERQTQKNALIDREPEIITQLQIHTWCTRLIERLN